MSTIKPAAAQTLTAEEIDRVAGGTFSTAPSILLYPALAVARMLAS